MLEVDKIL